MKLVAGQVAVITGAASGIGLALAHAFARRGLTVVLADVDEPRLEEAHEALTDTGINASRFRCDVARPDDVDALRSHSLSHHGQVDILCNNAGVILPFRPMWEHELSDWSWIMDINLRGVIHGIHAFAPLMVARNHGHILNTASMAGLDIIPFNGPYNAAKHAVISLTETLAAEFKARAPGVGATALCVGRVDTRIREAARHPARNDAGAAAAGTADVPDHPVAAPDDVARRALQAIEEDRTYAFTNPGAGQRIRQRFERLLADLSSSLGDADHIRT